MTNKQLDYFDLYEKLYQTGYHTDMSLSHTKKLYPHLHEVTPTDKEKLKILDVGCSNGLAVKELIDMGYDAYGVDVSKKAISLCVSRGLTTCKVGSATDIPWGDGFFDIIISSDTLEHVVPIDVSKVVSEFRRVCIGSCLLAIACDEEGNKQPLAEVKQKFNDYLSLNSLHTTIMTPDEWDACFFTGGYTKQKTIGYQTYDYEVVYKLK